MNTLENFLTDRPPHIVAITGGGGKTSLLFALGRTFPNALCTTTTKMGRLETLDFPSLFAARSGPDPAKVYGYAPAEIAEFWRQNPTRWIFVEADGSAGRPLKAPAKHEPVIPQKTGTAIAVLGLSCFGKPFSDETVFRSAEVAAITGLGSGDVITPESLAPLVDHPNGFFKSVPEDSRRILFCNQSDLPGAERAAAEFAASIRPGFLDEFLVGSVKTKGLRCHRI